MEMIARLLFHLNWIKILEDLKMKTQYFM